MRYNVFLAELIDCDLGFQAQKMCISDVYYHSLKIGFTLFRCLETARLWKSKKQLLLGNKHSETCFCTSLIPIKDIILSNIFLNLNYLHLFFNYFEWFY